MSVKTACNKFESLLGERFSRKEAVVTQYGQNTNGVTQNILAVVQPDTVEEVREIVRIAYAGKVHLYPISTGNNWGYGSSIPVTPENVIVDLSRMNRILDFDVATGVVTVEPGVTQQILYDFLVQNNLPFLTPTTGGGPRCSILGNVLERGYGITSIGDHFSAMTTISVVLADGSLYASPLEEMGAELIDRLHKYSVGPYLDGMFTQGNFGIAVSMSVTLARKPEETDIIFFGLAAPSDLPPLIPVVSQLLSSLGTLMGGINIMNKERIDAMVEDIPGNRMSQTPCWTGTGSISGDPRLLKAARKIVRQIFHNHTRHVFFINARTFSKWYPVLMRIPLPKRIKSQLQTFRKSVDIFLGIPSTVALPLSYLVSGTVPEHLHDANPAQDGCGLIWFTPLVPMKSEIVEKYVACVRRVCAVYAIEPLITLSSLNNRCFDSSVPLLFNRNNPEDIQRAHACYAALWDAVAELKLFPYRIPTDEMWRLGAQAPEFFNIVQKIKDALDPKGIIAPGRYTHIPSKK